MSDRDIRRLYRERPKSRLVFWSGIALLALFVYSWTGGDLGGTSDVFSPRHQQNLLRFLHELVPPAVAESGYDAGTALRWAVGLLREKGLEAAATTLALSVAAIVLAAIWGWILAPPAARTFATTEPYLAGACPPGFWVRNLWRLLVGAARLLQVFMRSIPEYVWAFLFLAILGPTAWPLVLALAVHNAGILGKLTSEVMENLEPAPLGALRGLGATRQQLAVAGLFPLTLPRFLLFFFYRWETCVREATVLGMLGIVSLGYWIVDARARQHTDEMFFLVLLGAGLVLVGDLVSAVARELVRRAA